MYEKLESRIGETLFYRFFLVIGLILWFSFVLNLEYKDSVDYLFFVMALGLLVLLGIILLCNGDSLNPYFIRVKEKVNLKKKTFVFEKLFEVEKDIETLLLIILVKFNKKISYKELDTSKVKEMKIILENYTVLNRVNNFIILGLLPVQTFITVKMLELLLDPKVKVSQYSLFFLVISIMFVFIYFIFNFSKKVNDIKYGK